MKLEEIIRNGGGGGVPICVEGKGGWDRKKDEWRGRRREKRNVQHEKLSGRRKVQGGHEGVKNQ